MKKIYLNLKVSVILNADDDISIEDMMDSIDLSATSESNKFDVEDVELSDYEINDVK